MPKYRVTLTLEQVVSRDFEVEAADAHEAMEIAEEESANSPDEWTDELASQLPAAWVTKVERVNG